MRTSVGSFKLIGSTWPEGYCGLRLYGVHSFTVAKRFSIMSLTVGTNSDLYVPFEWAFSSGVPVMVASSSKQSTPILGQTAIQWFSGPQNSITAFFSIFLAVSPRKLTEARVSDFRFSTMVRTSFMESLWSGEFRFFNSPTPTCGRACIWNNFAKAKSVLTLSRMSPDYQPDRYDCVHFQQAIDLSGIC